MRATSVPRSMAARPGRVRSRRSRAMSEHTRRAYEHDAREFVAVVRARRLPGRVRRSTTGRCGATSRTCRRAASRSASIARKAASVPGVPPPPAPARRARARRRRRGPGAQGRAPAAARCPRRNEAAALLDDLADRGRDPTIPAHCAISRSSSCSTAPDSGSANVAGSTSATSTSAGAPSPCSEKVQKSAASRSANRPATPSRRTSAPVAPAPDNPVPGRTTALFLNARGRRMTPRDVRRVLDRHPARRRAVAAPARSAARLRHPPPRRRSRSQSCSGAARTRRCGNDTDLHSRDS